MNCKNCGKELQTRRKLVGEGEYICYDCYTRSLGLKCEICGRDYGLTSITKNTKLGMVLCYKHNLQLNRYGKINNMTKFTPNEFILYEDKGYAEIVIRNHPKAGESAIEIARAIIDIDDVEKCKEYKWCLSKGYPLTTIKGTDRETIYLHNFVTNCPKDLFINHRDFNPMNARKYNLQKCTHEENSKYKNIYKNNNSGVKGVRDFGDKFSVESHFKEKYKYYGRFYDKREAVFCRLAIELINCREFTNLHGIIKGCKDYSIDFNEILCFLNDMKYDLSFLSNEFVVRDLEYYNIKVNLKPCTFEIKTCSLDLREIDLVTR